MESINGKKLSTRIIFWNLVSDLKCANIPSGSKSAISICIENEAVDRYKKDEITKSLKAVKAFVYLLIYYFLP